MIYAIIFGILILTPFAIIVIIELKELLSEK